MNRTAEPLAATNAAASPPCVVFDGWTLDRLTGDLWKEGVRQRLPEQPLQILNELLAKPGELVTREQLITRLWPRGIVEFDTGLNSAMKKLRAALRDDPNQPRYIETLPRKGYRFICRVEASEPAVVSEPGSLTTSSAGAGRVPTTRQPGSRTKRWMVAVSSLVLCVAALLFWHLNGRIAPAATPTPRVAFDLYLAATQRQPEISPMEGAQPRQRVLDLLGRALAIDPRFTAAYVVRARTNLDFFISNVDVSDGVLAAVRKDLEIAGELSQDPRAGVDVRALYAALVDLDPERGLRLAESAPDDPDAVRARATILVTLGRFRESNELFDRFLALDPTNQRLLRLKVSNLFVERRGREALEQVATLRDVSAPGRLPITWTYAMTGEVLGRRPSLAQVRNVLQAPDADDHVLEWWSEMTMLRIEHRYAEIHDLLSLLQAESVRVLPFTAAVPGVGKNPVAALRGWNDLMRGDAAAAAEEGRKILDFLSRQPVTRWNDWFLLMLKGEAQLLLGDSGAAVATVRESLRTPSTELVNRHTQVFRNTLAAITLAWAGEHEAAVSLVEELSRGAPSVGPAMLVRDPLISTPLEKNERYQKLRAALEIEMAANRQALRAREN